jgi:uncharacterized membrane protein YhhN
MVPSFHFTLNTATAVVTLSALLTGLLIRGGRGRPHYRALALLAVLASSAPYFIVLGQPSRKQRLDLVRTVLKLAPMASLGQLCVRTGKDEEGASWPYARLIAIGLGFSSCGDVALELNNDNPDGTLFLAGLGFFFVAHVLYIAAFASQASAPFASLGVGAALYALAAAFFLVLRGDMGPAADPRLGLPQPLQVPVMAYAAVIATMVWRAFARRARAEGPSPGSATFAALGALVFMVSDVCLGFAKFHTNFAYAKFVVMITYYVGQLGLAWSVHGSRTQSGPKKATKVPAKVSKSE